MRVCATTLQSEMNDAERACLYRWLRHENLRGKHLEIGTAAGGTLKGMMQCYTDTDRPPFVVVDPMTYFPNQLQVVQDNLSTGGLRSADVDFRLGKSSWLFKIAEAARELFAFILIDGVHKARYVMQDLRWAELLEVGGYLCLHDYSARTRGVMTSANRFLKKNKNYQIVDQVDSLLVIKKTAASITKEVGRLDLVMAHWVGFGHQMQVSLQKKCSRMQKRVVADQP